MFLFVWGFFLLVGFNLLESYLGLFWHFLFVWGLNFFFHLVVWVCFAVGWFGVEIGWF